ncbi:MAG: Ig-like domain-containing protein [Gemmatimonadota bacterium]|nr:Ig-like domain-containing protein [Gemmatimonadota bacterium]
MSKRSSLLSVVAAVLTVLPAWAGAAGQEAVRLVADPPVLALEVGSETRVEVRALAADGTVVDTPVRIVGPRGLVRVRGGVVTALEAGEAELIATATGGSGPLTLRIPALISWPAVTSVSVVGPGGGVVMAGTAVRLAVEATQSDGTVRPEAEAVWSSSDESVARVDGFGRLEALKPGRAVVTARVDGASGEQGFEVVPFPGETITLGGLPETVRTGDVVRFQATVRDANGRTLPDVPLEWSHRYETGSGEPGPPATGQMVDERFVADVPGIHTVRVDAGPLSARASFRVEARDVVQELEIQGQGREQRVRTTDFWVFEGLDGRDYALTGAKRSDGYGFVWDVTNPANIFKTDSIQVDARSVNDMKVSPDGRYATMTREGASTRRNGVVILDLADPAHPRIASEVTDHGLTGGVHNAFPTDTHVFALANGDKYVILDVTDLENPRYVGEYDHPDSRLHDVWVLDGLAYSAEWETGLVVVDVGDGRWGGSLETPVFVSSYPLPTGGTHAAFPYVSRSTGKHYVFVGDEIMNRRGLAWEGPGSDRGSYQVPYDPATGLGGVPLVTQGYVQIIDFSDPENPKMVARYEVPEYGTHNIWVEDDVLYQAYYEGGLRIVDVSGELMGNLYTQGREIAVFKPFDPIGYIPNSPMTWSAMPFKGRVFFSDTNSGLWSARLVPRNRPVS